MFQRFNFENLPPERQRELLEKQLKQQKQREMLQQQMETRKREKEIEKKREEQQQQVYEQSFQQPQQQQQQQSSPQKQQYTNPSQDFSQTYSKNMSNTNTIDFSRQDRNARTQPLVFSHSPLLPDIGNKFVPQRQVLTMSLTPNTIHDAFASLRHQIMSTAASQVIPKRTDPRSSRERKSMTFSEKATAAYSDD